MLPLISFSDTTPKWGLVWVARSIGLTAFGFLPLARFNASHVPGVRESLVVLQDDHAPVSGAKLSFIGLMGVLFSNFPLFSPMRGGGLGIPKVPSSCLDFGPVVRDRVRFAAMSKTCLLLSGYINLGF